jgi:tRNA nucleotidyltransferase/poly(A) polymerase
VLKVRLFVAAPSEGAERQDFTISALAANGQEKGDTDEVVFERPSGGQ